jgi:hypothetical protein
MIQVFEHLSFAPIQTMEAKQINGKYGVSHVLNTTPRPEDLWVSQGITMHS